jgi:hypothetical protein
MKKKEEALKPRPLPNKPVDHEHEVTPEVSQIANNAAQNNNL